MPKVEQSDRDRAASWLEHLGSQSVADFIRGKTSRHPLLDGFTDPTEHSLVQAFASHRLAAEQAARIEGVRMGLDWAIAITEYQYDRDKIRALDPQSLLTEAAISPTIIPPDHPED